MLAGCDLGARGRDLGTLVTFAYWRWREKRRDIIMRALTGKRVGASVKETPSKRSHGKESVMPLGTILESIEHEFDDEDWEEDEEFGTDEEELDLDDDEEALEDDDDI
jgi:hypothetical protein